MKRRCDTTKPAIGNSANHVLSIAGTSYEGETLGMWDEYGEVAIFSRFELLRNALDSFLDEVLLGAVRYGDKSMDRYNIFQFLFTKRNHFEKERELRALLESRDPVGGQARHFDAENRVYREPLDDINPLHGWVHDHKRRRIDLPKLVMEIRVSPWATDEIFEDVKLFANLKNVGCPLKWSELKGEHTMTRHEFRKHVKELP